MSKCSCRAKDDYECICWQNTVETKVQILERELAEAIKERDKARECLREAICYRDSSMSGYDLEEWREAAGENELTNGNKDEKAPIVNREEKQ
jgi:hypothetical protein